MGTPPPCPHWTLHIAYCTLHVHIAHVCVMGKSEVCVAILWAVKSNKQTNMREFFEKPSKRKSEFARKRLVRLVISDLVMTKWDIFCTIFGEHLFLLLFLIFVDNLCMQADFFCTSKNSADASLCWQTHRQTQTLHF